MALSDFLEQENTRREESKKKIEDYNRKSQEEKEAFNLKAKKVFAEIIAPQVNTIIEICRAAKYHVEKTKGVYASGRPTFQESFTITANHQKIQFDIEADDVGKKIAMKIYARNVYASAIPKNAAMLSPDKTIHLDIDTINGVLIENSVETVLNEIFHPKR